MDVLHLYGSQPGDLPTAAKRFSESSSFQLECRESAFLGPYFRDTSKRLSEYRLYQNIDPILLHGLDSPEDYWFEPEFQEFGILLDVEGTLAAVEKFHNQI